MVLYRSYRKRGLENLDIFEIVDDKGWYKAELHLPTIKWREYVERDDEVEMINEYTFPDFLIEQCFYETIEEDSKETVIVATIKPDLSC